MHYDYSRALLRDEVVVHLVDELCLYPDLADSIAKASKRYGFQFESGACTLQAPVNRNKAVVLRHLIIIDGIDNPEFVTNKYSDLVQKCTSATIAVSYSSKSTFFRATQDVERLKLQYEGKINYLLPSLFEEKYIPAKQKLIDNSICDSVRIKYVPKKTDELTEADIPTNIKNFFLKISDLIRVERLYHRASTDGFISIRSPDHGINSFYVTCTKTDKANIDISRIALINSYDRRTNCLSYKGSYLPSSDSVEAAILYQELSWMNGLVHTHASNQFTRNLKYRNRIAVPPSSYGEADLGSRISSFITQSSFTNFVIMEDHGELFLSGEHTPNRIFEDIFKCIRHELI